MKKKTKKVLIIISAAVLAVALTATVSVNLIFGPVKIGGRSVYHAGDYDEFYLSRERLGKPLIRIDLGGGGNIFEKIWFKPGQKKKCLAKIREDVENELDEVMANNSDILKGYEISKDFRKIYIYYYKGANIYKMKGEALNEIVNPKVELYHQLIHGSGKTGLSGVMNYVEEE